MAGIHAVEGTLSVVAILHVWEMLHGARVMLLHVSTLLSLLLPASETFSWEGTHVFGAICLRPVLQVPILPLSFSPSLSSLLQLQPPPSPLKPASAVRWEAMLHVFAERLLS